MNTMENATKRKTELCAESLESYRTELESDVDLNLMNIREKSMLVSTLRSKWLSYLFKEKENLEKIKKCKQKILESKIVETGGDVSLLRAKTEESIAKNSESMKKLSILEANTKSCIEFIEYAMVILNDLGFQIKNSIELLKLERL